MKMTLLTWRLPAELIPPPGEEGSYLAELTNEPSEDAAAVLHDPRWQAVSHAVTYDPDGPVLTVLMSRRSDD